jgi:hypothetical protein
MDTQTRDASNIPLSYSINARGDLNVDAVLLFQQFFRKRPQQGTCQLTFLPNCFSSCTRNALTAFLSALLSLRP